MSTKHRERNAAVCFADAFDTIGLANGNAVGGMVGLVDGAGLTGDRDGAFECDVVGIQLGDILGNDDSGTLGDDEGIALGAADGDADGCDVG